MNTKKAKSIEWIHVANRHTAVVLLETGERVIHSSANLGYLKRIVSEKGYELITNAEADE